MSNVLIQHHDALYELTHTDEKEDRWEMSRSPVDKGWTTPKSKVVILTDDGNHVKIKLEDKKLVTLDYHTVIELAIVLQEYLKSADRMEADYRKFIEEKNARTDNETE